MAIKILIFEPLHHGHRFEFVAHLVRCLSKIDRVEPWLATTQSATESEEFAAFLSDFNDKLKVYVVDDLDFHQSPLRNGFNNLTQFQQALKSVDPFHSYVPSAGGLTQCCRFSPKLAFTPFLKEKMKQTEALVLGGRFGYTNAQRPLKTFVSRSFIRMAPWTTTFHLDPYQVQYLQKHHCKSVRLMPDPVDAAPVKAKEAARKLLGLPTSGRYIGMTGWIQKIKGCDNLVQSFIAAKNQLADDDRLLLAGPFKDGLAEWISDNFQDEIESNRLLMLNRFLSVDEIDWAVQAMDLVCLPYLRAYQSSGVLLRAVAESKPVLVNNCGWLAKTVDQFDAGFVCDTTNIKKFSECIPVALQKSTSFTPSEKLRRFVKFHSVENFCATWTKVLRSKLELEPDPKLCEWDWVTDLSTVTSRSGLDTCVE